MFELHLLTEAMMRERAYEAAARRWHAELRALRRGEATRARDERRRPAAPPARPSLCCRAMGAGA